MGFREPAYSKGDEENGETPAGFSGTGETPQGGTTEEAHRPPRGKRSILHIPYILTKVSKSSVQE